MLFVMANATQQLLDRIPSEGEVRQRLVENLREAAVLRSLLRIARKKKEVGANSQSASHRR